MKAIVYEGAGDADVVRWVDRPDPEPGDGEVRIAVHACGVNRPDILQRQGRYPPPPGTSDVPGLEVAGVVDQVGPAVWDLKPGDRVCALVAGGGYAEMCVAPSAQCLWVPKEIELAAAAALPETVFTVWANLFDSAGLLAGERVLIHGGASGIGTTAIQMARAIGAEVYTTAGGSERADRCRDLGAALAVDYRSEDFVDRIRSHTGEEHPLQVVLDMVGGGYVGRNLSLLGFRGRHVSIGVQQGARVEIDVFEVMRRQLSLTGSTLRSRPVAEKGRLRDAVEARVWPWLRQGKLRPQISHRLPMEEAARGQGLLERSEHFGKVILLTELGRTLPPTE